MRSDALIPSVIRDQMEVLGPYCEAERRVVHSDDTHFPDAASKVSKKPLVTEVKRRALDSEELLQLPGIYTHTQPVSMHPLETAVLFSLVLVPQDTANTFIRDRRDLLHARLPGKGGVNPPVSG